MTTRRGAKGKFSIPSNFGFRRHHRDKKTKIKKNTYVRTRVKGGGNFRRNSMAVSKMGGGRIGEASVFACVAIIRLCRILPYPRYNPSLLPLSSNMQFRALTRQRRKEREEGGEGENILVSPRMVIHRDNLSGKLHRGWLRLDGFVTRFWNSTRRFVRRLRWFDSIRVDLAV